MATRSDLLDAELGVFISRYDDAAAAAAQLADRELAAGLDRGPLHGIPIGVKDIVACAEGPTTAQSRASDPQWWAGRDAPVIQRLRTAGAVIVGKTTTMEFAAGLPDPAAPFPVPRCPWDTDRWAGGSSSGSASGVSASMFLGAVGTDTAGSIRIPAAACGVTGFKPTFGLIPVGGIHPLAASLDSVGPIARSARDCAVMLDAMAGGRRFGDQRWTTDLTGTTCGVAWGVFEDNRVNDPALLDVFQDALAVLRSLGAAVIDVVLPDHEGLVAAMSLCSQAESYASHQPVFDARPSDYGPTLRSFLGGGAAIRAVDYIRARDTRAATMRSLDGVFDDVDLVVTPTLATGAIPLDGLGLETIVSHMYTSYWNGVGCPAISTPMGFTSDRLPLGLQLAGRPDADAAVLRAAAAYEEASLGPWVPPLVRNTC